VLIRPLKPKPRPSTQEKSPVTITGPGVVIAGLCRGLDIADFLMVVRATGRSLALVRVVEVKLPRELAVL